MTDLERHDSIQVFVGIRRWQGCASCRRVGSYRQTDFEQRFAQ
jgi:hypothetical protein